MKTVTVIHCWSAPRSRSTALLYSFEARGREECVAIDEPLYREWLLQRGEAVERPYTNEMITGTPPAGASPDEAFQWQREQASLTERIVQGADSLPGDGVIFCKHMAKHCFLYDFEQECQHPTRSQEVTLIHKHLLLIRDPVLVLSSWDNSSKVHGNTATPDEVGIVPLMSIYSSLLSRGTSSAGSSSVVLLDSDELAADPEGALANVCADLDIPYLESMITWESGPHACDGPWAKVSIILWVLKLLVWLLFSQIKLFLDYVL